MIVRRSHAGLALSLAALVVSGLASLVGAAPQAIHLLALRVEFPKEDPDDFTTGGNGLFDLRTPAQAMAAAEDSGFRYPYDLPPHDGAFLEHHLRALAHYVEVASRGQVELTWEMFPPAGSARAYTAPRTLATYGSGASDQERLVNWVTFLKDALDSSAADVGQLGRFQSFLVFNASVALQNVLSTELPPLVLTPREIAESGVSIPPEVRTAWFMPQQIQQPGGVIGLNGAFAKTFLASLGLPVLSNTRTGGAAVGGWTLMDVGSDNLITRTRLRAGSLDTTYVLGFVPCLPMAWEQMRLGWLEPTAVRSDTTILLAGLAVRETTLPRALRVPITESEYFLLELRYSAYATEKRHPEILYSLDDTSGVWLWPKDDDYDAYTPGSGVLVFHVDEERIRLWEPENAINAHVAQPGIFLVEADGYRDIGITNVLGHPRASEGIGSKNDPFPVTGEKQLYADGIPGPGHPVSLADDGTPTGIALTFAPVGDARDTVAVTVRWKGAGDGQARFARQIGGPVAGGVAVGNTGPTGSQETMIVVATTDGKVWAFDERLDPVGSATGLVAQFPESVNRKPIIEPDGAILVIGQTRAIRYRYTGGQWAGTLEPNPPSAPTTLAADLDRDGHPHRITWTLDGRIAATKDGASSWSVDLADSLVAPPGIGDVDGDEYPDVLVVGRRTAYALSRRGLSLPSYGLGRADSAESFTGPPLAASDGVFVPGEDAIYLFKGQARWTPYGKFFVPGNVSGAAALYTFGPSHELFVAVGAGDGWLYAFSAPDVGQPVLWGELYGDAASSNAFDSRVLPDPVALAELMPKDRAFFWPSPVGNTEGRLRFYLSAQADVAVRIYNAVGELVWEGSMEGARTTANADNELVWPGGTKFASGLYLCRLVATSADGRQSALTIPVGILR